MNRHWRLALQLDQQAIISYMYGKGTVPKFIKKMYAHQRSMLQLPGLNEQNTFYVCTYVKRDENNRNIYIYVYIKIPSTDVKRIESSQTLYVYISMLWCPVAKLSSNKETSSQICIIDNPIHIQRKQSYLKCMVGAFDSNTNQSYIKLMMKRSIPKWIKKQNNHTKYVWLELREGSTQTTSKHTLYLW